MPGSTETLDRSLLSAVGSGSMRSLARHSGETGLAPIVLLSFALAIIGAELATVFNNAMMPSLVSHRRLGTLSGIGWATGVTSLSAAW